MEVIKAKKEDMSEYGRTTTCAVHAVHIKIKDIKICAQEMMTAFEDTNWIEKLNAVGKISISARSEKTIDKLVNTILKGVDDKVTEDFGEYVISYYGQHVLFENFTHVKVPLPEFWKEKITGNPGFDFHTETLGSTIAFGEAKYNSNSNPYTIAIDQIIDFVKNKKDDAELIDLEKFVSAFAVQRYIDGFKAYVIAFSLKAKTPETVFRNLLSSDLFEELLIHSEIYVIGIEINA